jgi:hypothetical protein
MLQAGRPSVRVPDEVALGSTQPLTEMSSRNFPGGKKLLARRVDTLVATVSRISVNYGSLNLS